MSEQPLHTLEQQDAFIGRHIGPSADETAAMLAELNVDSLDQLIDQTVPDEIRMEEPLPLAPPATEARVLADLKAIARQNRIQRSLIGMGYYDTHTPPVIQRNVLENPGWYTAYTPYQPEVSQGRLEA